MLNHEFFLKNRKNTTFFVWTLTKRKSLVYGVTSCSIFIEKDSKWKSKQVDELNCRVNTPWNSFQVFWRKMKNRYPGNIRFFCTCEYCIFYYFGDFENSTFFCLNRSLIRLPRQNIFLEIPLSWNFCQNQTSASNIVDHCCYHGLLLLL